MPANFQTNDFRDDLRDKYGHVDMTALANIRGSSFDKANDLWIDHNGRYVHPRVGKPVSIGNLGLLGACCDALMLWEREKNGMAAYNHRYADDPTENALFSEE